MRRCESQEICNFSYDSFHLTMTLIYERKNMKFPFTSLHTVLMAAIVVVKIHNSREIILNFFFSSRKMKVFASIHAYQLSYQQHILSVKMGSFYSFYSLLLLPSSATSAITLFSLVGVRGASMNNDFECVATNMST